ncbi:NAD(P)H-binding protein [Pseudonocardia sp. TRM90224]|uniref:NAD(P)H-binding protein n=1 Tax=Pseudonocardia sp. TRM90224 TaxID=2812678 RepID=UPI001E28CDA9|nr:NAD(P)H-binding protein [Pseudonocardia sp. TRM90224]
MTVLVTGGRGTVATGVAHGLHAAGVPVRIASREPASVRAPDGVEVVQAALDDAATLAPALDGVDKVFLYADRSGGGAFVDAARAAGVEQVVLLSSSAALDPGNVIGEHHRVVEDTVSAAGFATTLLRPGGFADNTRQWLPGIEKGVVRMAYPDTGGATMDERDIADVAVTILLAGPGAGHDGTAPELTGPQALSRREEAETIAAALGRSITVEAVDEEEARREMSAFMPDRIVDALIGYWRAYDGLTYPPTDAVERITGRPARTLAQWAAEVVAPEWAPAA